MLLLCAPSEGCIVRTAQTRVGDFRNGQGIPKGRFAQNAQGERLQRFERAEAPVAISSQLQATGLLRQPSDCFLHAGRMTLHRLGQLLKYSVVGLDFARERGGETGELILRMMFPQILQKFQRERSAGEMVVEVGAERIVHAFQCERKSPRRNRVP